MSSLTATDEYNFAIVVNNKACLYVSFDALIERAGIFAYDFENLKGHKYKIVQKVDVAHLQDFFRYVLNDDTSALTVKNANAIYNLCQEFQCLREQNAVKKFMRSQEFSVIVNELNSCSDDASTALLEETLTLESLISLFERKAFDELPVPVVYRILEKGLSRNSDSRVLNELVYQFVVSVLRNRGEDGLCLLGIVNWEFVSVASLRDLMSLEVIQKSDPCAFVRLSHMHSLHDKQSALETRVKELEAKLEGTEEAISELKKNYMKLEEMQTACLHYQAYFLEGTKASWTGRVPQGTTLERPAKTSQLLAIQFDYNGPGKLLMRGHIAGPGWLDWVTSGQICGTVDAQHRRLEAVEVKIENADSSDFTFTVWMHPYEKSWHKVGFGKTCGTTGEHRKVTGFHMAMQLK